MQGKRFRLARQRVVTKCQLDPTILTTPYPSSSHTVSRSCGHAVGTTLDSRQPIRRKTPLYLYPREKRSCAWGFTSCPEDRGSSNAGCRSARRPPLGQRDIRNQRTESPRGKRNAELCCFAPLWARWARSFANLRLRSHGGILPLKCAPSALVGEMWSAAKTAGNPAERLGGSRRSGVYFLERLHDRKVTSKSAGQLVDRVTTDRQA